MIKRFLLSAKGLAIVNSACIGLMIFGNSVLPALCSPTTWATVVLLICFVVLILYPFFQEHEKWLPLISFINGISFWVLLYCLLFIGSLNFFSVPLIALFGFGLFLVAPQFLLLQLLWKYSVKPVSKKARLFFLSSCIPCAIVVIYSVQSYRSSADNILAAQELGFETLEGDFMTEKILGMHFIYHTEFCEYDGWRPPKHEPLMVIGMFFYGGDPLNLELEQRVKIYKKVFPENRIKFNCSCTWSGDEHYYFDSRLLNGE